MNDHRITSRRSADCCADCEHQVTQITARGLMPDTEDGREVRLLIARDVGPCESCGKDD